METFHITLQHFLRMERRPLNVNNNSSALFLMVQHILQWWSWSSRIISRTEDARRRRPSLDCETDSSSILSPQMFHVLHDPWSYTQSRLVFFNVGMYILTFMLKVFLCNQAGRCAIVFMVVNTFLLRVRSSLLHSLFNAGLVCLWCTSLSVSTLQGRNFYLFIFSPDVRVEETHKSS